MSRHPCGIIQSAFPLSRDLFLILVAGNQPPRPALVPPLGPRSWMNEFARCTLSPLLSQSVCPQMWVPEPPGHVWGLSRGPWGPQVPWHFHLEVAGKTVPPSAR